ncbi:GHKL domain-containing protein [Enterococcus larvae]|uniref:GHKL domain-containing protein n=1 Tax=Enterococcus larvae TaxID=2794352 RepID=UPI003F412715
MISLLMSCFICIFELYILYDFGKNLLHLNKLRSSFKILMNSCILFIFLLINAVNNSLVNLLVVPILYLVFSIINFEGTLLKKTFLSICYYTLAVFPEFIFTLSANLDADFSHSFFLDNEVTTFIVVLLMKMTTFVLIKCIEQFSKKKYYRMESDRIFLSLLVLPTSTIILLSGLFYSDVHMLSNEISYRILLGVVLLLFSNIFLFYLFDNMIMNIKRSQSLEKLYLKSSVEQRYLEQMRHSDEEQRSLLHDIKKYIRAAAYCVEMGNKIGAIDIFEKLDVKIQTIEPVNYCSNQILNVILAERSQEAKKKGIKFSVNVEPGVNFIFIDDIDIISIMGNLMDNAYEAAVTKENGFIEINIFMENKGHFLIVNVANNFNKAPVYGPTGYLTGKVNKNKHGIGLQTVERIVKQYGGQLKIDVDKEKSIFEIVVLFQI